ncbi:hypothetical protein HUT29_30060 [Pseudomonas chlororaphis]|uniref:hypothetical protein n=1 Tax=Pseudomonas chlororaphis TaxID=587753 RepID=UPI001B30F9D8|nr:hypothetical protein [Pseudomonas chlororaphis]QTT85347.1 hypothetical protein HUT29_30060 [Pseudomonas chlororaphis]
MTLEPLERRIEMARRHQRAALVMIGFAVALMVTLLSSSFALSLVGAGGFVCQRDGGGLSGCQD